LERVAGAYWKPIYSYIRRVWSKSDADAKDLTQSFLVHALKSELIAKFDAARGNFRSYLKQCLKNFLATDARDSDRLKRGGGAPTISIDATLAIVAPEADFDRDWAHEVVDRCLRELEEYFRSRKQQAYFDVLRLYAIEGEGDVSYEEIAARLKISESNVRNYLRVARRELRQRVIQAIGEYVADEDGARSELSQILGEA
jgi:RNA polymerase sigma-70 factor (ECF subfamily)